MQMLFVSSLARNFSGDELGRGAGKGGGAGGPVREAGGSFGKREAALEGEYFHRLEAEQIKEFKKHLEDEVSHHKAQIKQHKEAIERHEKKMKKLGKL